MPVIKRFLREESRVAMIGYGLIAVVLAAAVIVVAQAVGMKVLSILAIENAPG